MQDPKQLVILQEQLKKVVIEEYDMRAKLVQKEYERIKLITAINKITELEGIDAVIFNLLNTDMSTPN